jgi:hypothetical protein
MKKLTSLSRYSYIRKQKALFLLLLFLSTVIVLAGVGRDLLPSTSMRVSAAQQSDHGASLWQDVDEKSIPNPGNRSVIPRKYRTLHLNKGGLKQLLNSVPLERPGAPRGSGVQIALPMPDGSFASFQIVESPIMEPGLARQFPEIRSYRGQGLDDPSATMRFIVTPSGFHAIVLSAGETVLIDPYSQGDVDHHISYKKQDLERKNDNFQCFAEAPNKQTLADPKAMSAQMTLQNFGSIGGTLRTYSLAVAATVEYTAVNGGTSGAFQTIATTINHVNAIYERELAVHFDLVANEMSIIFSGPADDGYTNGNPSLMRGENQTKLDSKIGDANYDIGHVFGTNGGGEALLGVVCTSQQKANGATSAYSNVSNSVFEIEFVSHEIGHQFGAFHIFNGESGSCGNVNGANQRTPSSAFEPGAGSTIMGYVHKCYPQDQQPAVDDYFNTASLEQILGYIGGTSCFSSTSTGNSPPAVDAGQNYTIPRATPFTLTAAGSDPNVGDPVFYVWEENDVGFPSPPDSDADGRMRPLFRSVRPDASPSRTFPSLSSILDYSNVPPALLLASNSLYYIPGEALPLITRTMTFRATARDYRSGGGGVSTDDMHLNVTSSAGPFYVTQPNTATVWNPALPVTWNVANTTAPTVNCSTVRISLSTDGGVTFPSGLVLSPSTANDGSELVTVPANVTSTQARIKVESVGNIFFDISDTNFIIPASGCSYSISPSSSGFGFQQFNGSFNVANSTGCAWQAKSNAAWIAVTQGSGSGNGTVAFTVQANVDGAARSGTISVAGRTHTVTQNSSGTCAYSINPLSDTYGLSGGTGNIAITTSATCKWTASSNVTWVSIISGSSGLGSGSLLYTVTPNNTGSTRSGTLNVAGFTFTVTQNAIDAQSPLVAIITADNGYEFSFNGTLRGSVADWTHAQSYNLPIQPGKNVVAIKGIDAGWIGALLVELQISGQRIGSSVNWKVSTNAPANWTDVNFDDSGWANATEYGTYGVGPWGFGVIGMPVDTRARWIWSSNSEADDVVYVRFSFNGAGGNTPPTVNLTAPQNNATFTAPANITLSANAADADGTVTSVGFFANDILIQTDQSAPYSINWNNVASGNYSLTAKATDDQGAITVSAPVTITVSPPGSNLVAIVTADNGYDFYFNGIYRGSGADWTHAQSYNLPIQTGKNVVAIKGIDAGWIGALLAELQLSGQRIGSAVNWKVSVNAPANWADVNFDDSGWANATEYGSYGVGPWGTGVSGMAVDTPARWIWSSNNDADDVVYVRYSFTVTPPGSNLVAIVTADNGFDFYFNGIYRGSGADWSQAQTYNLQMQTGQNVVAIRCTDAGWIAGLLAELQVSGQRIGSSASWKVSLTAPANWADVNFNDSGWANATEYGPYGLWPWGTSVSGMPLDTPAKWIWSSNNDAHDLVYVRITLSSS